MTPKQSLKYQLLAAECGFAFEILYTVFWAGFGHNLPPASPSLSAQDLASIFAQHHNAILFGNCMAAHDHRGYRRCTYRLGIDVLSRNMGGSGVPARC